MIRRPLKRESLQEAMSLFGDFKAVHSGKEDYYEALTILRESLGLDDDLLEEWNDEMTELLGESVDSSLLAGALFGLIVGLIAADHASEIRPDTES